MELTNAERFARMAQLDDKIESTNDKLKQLKEDRDALAHGLDFGAYEGGGYAVTVVETKRFNPGVAANLISEGKMGVTTKGKIAELLASVSKTTVDSTLAKKYLTGEQYAACQTPNGRKVTVKRLEDYDV